ncbi:MAG: EutN/CcmL family microcompartment protein [Myxococcaceae bacterium]|nr:EutN/CcmL family microcompartment protein [Myxococcaceae bacterium]
MNLCRVLGTVVCTEKHPVFVGRKLLVVQPVSERLEALGTSFIAIDHSSGAGEGDLVLVLGEGNGVRQILEDKMAPVRHCIVGVVDQVSVGAA